MWGARRVGVLFYGATKDFVMRDEQIYHGWRRKIVFCPFLRSSHLFKILSNSLVYDSTTHSSFPYLS